MFCVLGDSCIGCCGVEVDVSNAGHCILLGVGGTVGHTATSHQKFSEVSYQQNCA